MTGLINNLYIYLLGDYLYLSIGKSFISIYWEIGNKFSYDGFNGSWSSFKYLFIFMFIVIEDIM